MIRYWSNSPWQTWFNTTFSLDHMPVISEFMWQDKGDYQGIPEPTEQTKRVWPKTDTPKLFASLKTNVEAMNPKVKKLDDWMDDIFAQHQRRHELMDSINAQERWELRDFDDITCELRVAVNRSIDASTPGANPSPRSTPGFSPKLREHDMEARRLKRKFASSRAKNTGFRVQYTYHQYRPPSAIPRSKSGSESEKARGNDSPTLSRITRNSGSSSERSATETNLLLNKALSLTYE